MTVFETSMRGKMIDLYVVTDGRTVREPSAFLINKMVLSFHSILLSEEQVS